MAEIDHLVYAVPELDAAVERLDHELGVRPEYGGAHPGFGTHNALVSLGAAYLEVIAPDPGQPEPAMPRPFGVDGQSPPRLVTFAVRPSAGETIEDLVARCHGAGHDPGGIISMQRTRPDGVTLHWRLTVPGPPADGPTPFLIDWGAAASPAETAPSGAEVVELTASHLHPDRLRRLFGALDVDVPVEEPDAGHDVGHPVGRGVGLNATLRGPGGRFEP